MKAMVYYGTNNIKLEEVAVPEVQPGTVLVKVKYTGICGTDLHEYHKQGFSKVPMILGHEITGEIVNIGESVSNYKVGDRVVIEPIITCNECSSCRKGNYNTCEHLQSYGLHHPGGFAEYILVKEKNLVPLPENMSYELAALVEPAAVAMQAVKSSALKIGDKAAVFGGGPIGLLVTQCAKAAGASQIIVVEIEEKRQQLALEMGADYVINPQKEDAVKRIRELSNGGVDVSFDAAGVEATFHAGLSSLIPGGELMIISVFTKPVAYNIEIQRLGERKINTSRAYKNIFPQVISLMEKGSININPIITSKISLKDIVEQGFNKLSSSKDECKILVSPE
ncbi:2,3-butanediol dehydrogenase [Neobacillus mesonae]|uniref:2,3-butanediol dehydrogenase n=1 Tax=Neobacillus mesonae TaxID=1193713 RepID=UPI00203DF1E5|nr:2,3-butanediol dehydrogenase [Neobacillus mesonae]MCM3567512.1 2,3-butanediol dehydrogenase [Neobacillus mesonae]